MATKTVSQIAKGDKIRIGDRILEVTDARKHRRYAGYYAIQYRDENGGGQVDLLGVSAIEVS